MSYSTALGISRLGGVWARTPTPGLKAHAAFSHGPDPTFFFFAPFFFLSVHRNVARKMNTKGRRGIEEGKYGHREVTCEIYTRQCAQELPRTGRP